VARAEAATEGSMAVAWEVGLEVLLEEVGLAGAWEA